MKVKVGSEKVEVLDSLCPYRRCYWRGEDKGTFVQGRGYTSYYKTPYIVCWTRHTKGCPHPIPEIDSERLRCCSAMDFAPGRKGKRAWSKRCRGCGQWSKGLVLTLRLKLLGEPR